MEFLKLWFSIAVLSAATIIGVGIGSVGFLALLWILISTVELLVVWFGKYLVFSTLAFVAGTLFLTVVFYFEEKHERERQADVDERR